ncbi:MAG: hypothetical protein KDE15_04525 [Erythrobacter sp.]|nr:hypothetical protein [Erythrobacter sp.]
MNPGIHIFERLPQVDASPAGTSELARPPVRGQPLVGLVRNVRSHRNARGGAPDALPDNVLLATPRLRSELPAILADLAAKRVDYIAIDGGDGTVRDVLTCGMGVFGDSWPTLIVLPSGKTNALGHDLGLPQDFTLDDALAAAASGTLVRRQPLVITQRDKADAQVCGFVMGAGAFNRAITLGQRSHKLGAFNAAVVGLTALWSVGQALFGSYSNPWRQGTRMRLRLADGSDLPHRGGLPSDERYMLFASTLERFPAGLDPFRGIDSALRLGVFDNPRRNLLLRFAAVARGTAGRKTRLLGFHSFGADVLDLDISDAFILDGEAFPAGSYRLSAGPKLRFVVP